MLSSLLSAAHAKFTCRAGGRTGLSRPGKAGRPINDYVPPRRVPTTINFLPASSGEKVTRAPAFLCISQRAFIVYLRMLRLP